MSKLYYQMGPLATELLSLFQAMGVRSDIRALKTNGTCYFNSFVYSVTPIVILESVEKNPSLDFFFSSRMKSHPFFPIHAYIQLFSIA